MSLTYDTREEMEARGRRRTSPAQEQSSGAEITLGTRSLLGIFFGLVLICGIFFGLGYSVGRVGSAQDVPTSPTAGLSAESHLQKPSAAQETLTPVTTPGPADSGNPGPSQDAAAASAPAQNGTAPVTTVVDENTGPAAKTSPAPAPQLTPAVVTQPVATAGSAPPGPAGTAPAAFMVQVAAVRVQQDADILVSALGRRGFQAVVRHEPQDALLHVQLGPFATRAEAMTMRSRLLAQGYNAVVK
jgi:DedD protein